MNDEIICEKCGSIMESHDQEHTASMICPKCGWGWAATYNKPIDVDWTDYAVFLQPGNSVDTANIKLIASVCSVNYLEARRILQSDTEVCVFTANNDVSAEFSKAGKVKHIATLLSKNGMKYRIRPDFPYEV